MHHAVDPAIESDKQAELGDVADLAFDGRSRRVIGGKGDPRILLGLLQPERNPALVRIDLEHLDLDLLARGDDLAGVDVLLGPAHLRHMDQPLDAGLELDEGAVVGDVGDRALEAGARRVFGGDALPRIGFELFDAEADALGFRIDADDLHLHRVADIHDLARMIDAPPRHVGDVKQPVDAAKIDEGAVIGDVLDHAVDDLALFETGNDLAALLGTGLFEHGTARNDDIAAPSVHLEDLAGLRHVHQRADIADRADVHLASRQEGHGAVEIDGEPALDAVEDHTLNALARLVFLFEPGPALLAARLFARQHRFAGRVLDPLEINVDFVADGKIGRAARDAKLLEGDAAFGLQPDIDDSDVFFDSDDSALDHAAFLERGTGERLFKKGREFVAARVAHTRLRLGHVGSYSASHHTYSPASLKAQRSVFVPARQTCETWAERASRPPSSVR